MEKIAIAYSKGGTTKSTTAVNTATSIDPRLRVCLVDLDQVQAHATKALIPEERREELQWKNSYRFMKGATSLSDSAIQSKHPNISVVGSVYFDPMDLNDLPAVEKATTVLTRFLHIDHEPFDYVIIDPPGTLHIETMAAWVGATSIVIPVTPGEWSLDIFEINVQSIAKTRKAAGQPPVPVLILPSRVSSRSEEHRGFLAQLPNMPRLIAKRPEIADAFAGFRVLPPVPENANVQISAEQGLPMSPRSKAYAAYSDLLLESHK